MDNGKWSMDNFYFGARDLLQPVGEFVAGTHPAAHINEPNKRV